MSTRVKVSTYLLVSKGLLPYKDLNALFNSTLSKHNCTISNGMMYHQKKLVGRITFNDRILLETRSPIDDKLSVLVDEIRKDIAFQAQVIQGNLILENQRKIQSETRSMQILEKLEEELETEKLKMNKSLQIQKMNAIEAIHQELVETAQNNGFEILETHNKNNQIVLQFVRREF